MDWGNLGLFALLTIGHTELMVAVVNRTHAWPLGHQRLRTIRHLHDLAVPLFPLLLIGGLGLMGPRLLLGGTWADVPVACLAYFALCGLGLLGLVLTVARHWLQRPPVALVETRSTVVDATTQASQSLAGDGKHQSLLKVPGNQVFTFEVSEKTFRLPHLPAAWDGLTLWHLSDWHYTGTPTLEFYQQVTQAILERPADCVIFSGDLMDRDDLRPWIQETLGKLAAPLGCYFILGNHDWYLDTPAVRNELKSLGWIDVSGKVVEVNHQGHRLLIGGDETPWMGVPPCFSLHEQEHLPDPVAGVPRDHFRLLVSHTPDHFWRAARDGIDLMLSGHTHGGQVQLPGIGPVFSPSRYGVRYASGTFYQQETLMHVSRGLGGRHPLRIRCRPEVTRITLRSVDRMSQDS
ncbi:MAG: metallophosphoesterase [Planctomycetaceae bacterium]